jgi:hypothetical protein
VVAGVEKLDDGVGTDVPGAAGDEDGLWHGASLPPRKRSDQRNVTARGS